MSVTLRLDGLAELRAALRALPEELTSEANDIVLGHAATAAREIETGYPQGPTGNLKARVSALSQRSRLSANAIVSSRAPHASLFEKGTKVRRTNSGANRGIMPKASPEQAFIPKAIRARRAMEADLVELVRRAGFEVSL